MMSNNELIKKAYLNASLFESSDSIIAGEICSALLTTKGNVYFGISVDAQCGIGFCAEHHAIANMLINRENRINKIVSVNSNGKIIPPCGRCRELMYQVNPLNIETEVILSEHKAVKLEDLLPYRWQEF